MMCKVYTDVGGIKYLNNAYPFIRVRKIINSLKLVDYLHVQADNPWDNYYIEQLIGKIFILSLIKCTRPCVYFRSVDVLLGLCRLNNRICYFESVIFEITY